MQPPGVHCRRFASAENAWQVSVSGGCVNEVRIERVSAVVCVCV